MSEIIITDVRYYSKRTGFLDNPDFSTIDVYGAAMGNISSGTCISGTSTDSTCDNCDFTTTSIQACSQNRIHDNLQLEISFTTNVFGNLFVQMASTAGDFLSDRINTNRDNAERLGADGTVASVTFRVAWSDLCKNAGGKDASITNEIDCNSFSSNISSRLVFGIDGGTNGNGIGNGNLGDAEDDINSRNLLNIHIRGDNSSFAPITYCTSTDTSSGGPCNFSVFPGDKKIYVDAIRTFSTLSSSDYSAIRMFYTPVENATDTSTLSAATARADLAITGSDVTAQVVSTKTNEIDGLENGQLYHFQMATVDIANNIGFFVGAPEQCFDPGETGCHVVSPDEVVGLFPDEFDCFIATAAFGSPLEPHVADFREFRNRYLHPFQWGQKIIKTYYKNSPPFAQFLDRNPEWKPFARALLWPLWAIAKIGITLGAPLSILLTFLFAFAFFSFIRSPKKDYSS